MSTPSSPSVSGHSNTRRSKKHRLEDALDNSDRKRAKKSLLNEFLNVARWIGRSEDPFLEFSMTFEVGMLDGASAGARNCSGVEDSEDETPVPDYEHHLRIYALLKQRIAGFDHHVNPIRKQPDVLSALISAMAKALGSARSDDVSSLREAGLAYIALDTPSLQLEPAIPPRSSKSMRGFNHPVLARLLCPLRLVLDFDVDKMETMKKLQTGDITVPAMDFPTFLYPNNAVYDCNDIENGLFRGPLVVRVWKHIFTSPLSAIRPTPGTGRSKSCQAKMNHLTAVTPRTIAYAAVHARWLICAQDDWRAEDGAFDKNEFFKMIVLLFESSPDDEWCIETLAWWNKQVFKEIRVAEPSQASSANDVKLFLAQRLAKSGTARDRPLLPGLTSPISSPIHHPRSSPNRSTPPTSPPCLSPQSAVASTSSIMKHPAQTLIVTQPHASTSHSHCRIDPEPELDSELSTPPSSPPQPKGKGKRMVRGKAKSAQSARKTKK